MNPCRSSEVLGRFSGRGAHRGVRGGCAIGLVGLAVLWGACGCASKQSGPPVVATPPPGYTPSPDAVIRTPTQPVVDASAGGDAADAKSPGSDALDAGTAASDAPAPGDAAKADGAVSGGPDAVLPPGKHPLGGPCESKADCADDGASCVEWPPGKHVCTLADCNKGTVSCPAGSTCIPFGGSTWGCMPDCASDADCRPGYPCKAILLPEGMARVCYGVNAAAGSTAMLCKGNEDCAKHAACLAPSLGGYCAVLGCDEAHPCPAKTACVDFPNAGKACAAVCTQTSNCPAGAAGLQECVESAKPDGEIVDVCLPTFPGQPTGNTCKSDDQCAVGVCKLTSKGSCAGNGTLCLDDGECGSNGPCVADPAFEQGVCLVPCQDSSECSEGTVCVPDGPSTGFCRATCKSLADQFTCSSKQHELCLFGYTPEDTAGDGVFACAASPPGSPGWPCDPQANDCNPPAFCMPGNDPGTGQCVVFCENTMSNGLNYCPWGTVCVSNASSTQCMKTCPAGKGCPDGFVCRDLFLGLPFSVKVCAR